jgi:hypothetical protein
MVLKKLLYVGLSIGLGIGIGISIPSGQASESRISIPSVHASSSSNETVIDSPDRLVNAKSKRKYTILETLEKCVETLKEVEKALKTVATQRDECRRSLNRCHRR